MFLVKKIQGVKCAYSLSVLYSSDQVTVERLLNTFPDFLHWPDFSNLVSCVNVNQGDKSLFHQGPHMFNFALVVFKAQGV